MANIILESMLNTFSSVEELKTFAKENMIDNSQLVEKRIYQILEEQSTMQIMQTIDHLLLQLQETSAICGKCKKQLACPCSRKRHEQKCTGPKTAECSVCHKVFHSNSYRSKHESKCSGSISTNQFQNTRNTTLPEDDSTIQQLV